MSALKKPSSLRGLYSNASAVPQAVDEKREMEALRKRIQDLLERDPAMARKAATVLEQWLNPKRR